MGPAMGREPRWAHPMAMWSKKNQWTQQTYGRRMETKEERWTLNLNISDRSRRLLMLFWQFPRFHRSKKHLAFCSSATFCQFRHESTWLPTAMEMPQRSDSGCLQRKSTEYGCVMWFFRLRSRRMYELYEHVVLWNYESNLDYKHV
jgi:hypothetical protein